MPNYCAVQNCKSNTRNKLDCRNIKFFTFPKNENISREWIKACGRNNIRGVYQRVCSLHFTEEDWRLKDRLLNTSITKRFLNPNAIPSRLLPMTDTETTSESVIERSPENATIQDLDISILQKELENNHVKQLASNSKTVNGKLESENEKRARKFKILKLEKQLQAARKENVKLKKQHEKLRSLETSVTAIFTSGQIKKLKHPNKKCNWSMDAISTAICLQSEGPRAYRYLYKRSFPFPSPLTLKKWALQLNVRRK